jgi:signal transduction histidine kinase
VLDAGRRVLYLNQAAARLLGRVLPEGLPKSAAEFCADYVLYRPDGTLLPEEEWPEVRAHCGEIVSGAEVLLAPRGTQERRLLRVSGAPLHDPGGGLLGVVLILNRGTERKEEAGEPEQVLSQNENRRRLLHAMLEIIPDIVSVWSADERIVVINQAGLKFLGAKNLEDARRRITEDPYSRLSPRDSEGQPLPESARPFRRALAGETVVAEDITICHPVTQRRVWLRFHALPIRDHAGKVVAAVTLVQDMTVVRELDRLKEQFIRTAAHELKTPVAILKGYAQALLTRESECTAPQREKLEAIRRGADRIDLIVRDILDLLQLTRGRLRLARSRVDLTALVEEAIRVAAATTSRHRLVSRRTTSVTVEGDHGRLLQILAHLLGNAIKFSPHGGDIMVDVTVEGDDAEVRVQDHGVGIPRERQARVFEDFYRAHADTAHGFGGIGVGLYLVYELVRLHSGRVWFESEEGQGSIFAFRIPRRN